MGNVPYNRARLPQANSTSGQYGALAQMLAGGFGGSGAGMPPGQNYGWTGFRPKGPTYGLNLANRDPNSLPHFMRPRNDASMMEDWQYYGFDSQEALQKAKADWMQNDPAYSKVIGGGGGGGAKGAKGGARRMPAPGQIGDVHMMPTPGAIRRPQIGGADLGGDPMGWYGPQGVKPLANAYAAAAPNTAVSDEEVMRRAVTGGGYANG